MRLTSVSWCVLVPLLYVSLSLGAQPDDNSQKSLESTSSSSSSLESLDSTDGASYSSDGNSQFQGSHQEEEEEDVGSSQLSFMQCLGVITDQVFSDYANRDDNARKDEEEEEEAEEEEEEEEEETRSTQDIMDFLKVHNDIELHEAHHAAVSVSSESEDSDQIDEGFHTPENRPIVRTVHWSYEIEESDSEESDEEPASPNGVANINVSSDPRVHRGRPHERRMTLGRSTTFSSDNSNDEMDSDDIRSAMDPHHRYNLRSYHAPSQSGRLFNAELAHENAPNHSRIAPSSSSAAILDQELDTPIQRRVSMRPRRRRSTVSPDPNAQPYFDETAYPLSSLATPSQGPPSQRHVVTRSRFDPRIDLDFASIRSGQMQLRSGRRLLNPTTLLDEELTVSSNPPHFHPSPLRQLRSSQLMTPPPLQRSQQLAPWSNELLQGVLELLRSPWSATINNTPNLPNFTGDDAFSSQTPIGRSNPLRTTPGTNQSTFTEFAQGLDLSVFSPQFSGWTPASADRQSDNPQSTFFDSVDRILSFLRQNSLQTTPPSASSRQSNEDNQSTPGSAGSGLSRTYAFHPDVTPQRWDRASLTAWLTTMDSPTLFAHLTSPSSNISFLQTPETTNLAADLVGDNNEEEVSTVHDLELHDVQAEQVPAEELHGQQQVRRSNRKRRAPVRFDEEFDYNLKRNRRQL